ncbi:hypothetical protein [Vibrio phage vB_pir03]|nr:hypothetical protein [Vibrio phage vB_pir03]
MLLSKRAGDLANLPNAWIIEGTNNVYLECVKVIDWPFPAADKRTGAPVMRRGIIAKVLVNEAQEIRIYPVETELDLYNAPMVGLAASEWNPNFPVDREWLDFKGAVVFEKDKPFVCYVGETTETLSNILADAYFDEDETIQTLGQFKAQSGYQKMANLFQIIHKRGLVIHAV